MHDLKTIKKTLRILKKLDYKYRKTSRLTGIKPQTIHLWHKKQLNGEPLLTRPFVHHRRRKRNDEECKKVIDYYFEHGQSITTTVRKFGYPSKSTLKNWVKKDKRYKKKNKILVRNLNNYSSEDKVRILKSFCSSTATSGKAANELGVTRTTIYNWHKELTGEGMKKEKSKTKEELLRLENTQYII